MVLHAELAPTDGSLWRSETAFVADADGSVDLTAAAPVAGNYVEASPMGFLWSMQPVREASPAAPSLVGIQDVRLQARGDDGAVAEVEFEQYFVAPGVTRREVCEDGMVATLFIPPGAGPHPVVVMLAGSGGGLMEARAALFAAHGYAALALGYFGTPGLPAHISRTPLEYFERALQWVHRALSPADGFVAVAGVSRGGELSLLLGATFPQSIRAVVAYVPSPFTHGVLNAGRPGEDRHAPTWTYRGRALPVLSADNTRANWPLFDNATPPKRQTPAFLSALEDAQAVSRAFIPLERIAGPVLLISGEDDQLWPSTRFAELAEQRLAQARHPFPVVHLRYADAGHSIQFPFVPTTVVARRHPVSGIEMAYGGSAVGNARANADSWPRVLDFLAEARAAAAKLSY